MTKILVRADDAGASPGTNRAIRACVAAGAVKNVSIMAVGPAFDDLAAVGEILVCHGVHAIINSEWDAPRWGPLTSAPSLTDADGTFRRFPKDHAEAGFRLEEVEDEIVAQIVRVRRAGFTPSYLDEHMGFSWLPGVREILVSVAAREGLIYRPEVPVEFKVFHPSEDDADSRRWIHEGLRPGQIAEDRAKETAFLLREKWEGWTLVDYRDLASI